MKFLEHQCWVNEPNSRHECWEISGIPESVTDKDLKSKVLSLFKRIDIKVYPNYFEAFHSVKSNAGLEIKMSRHKD